MILVCCPEGGCLKARPLTVVVLAPLGAKKLLKTEAPVLRNKRTPASFIRSECVSRGHGKLLRPRLLLLSGRFSEAEDRTTVGRWLSLEGGRAARITVPFRPRAACSGESAEAPGKNSEADPNREANHLDDPPPPRCSERASKRRKALLAQKLAEGEIHHSPHLLRPTRSFAAPFRRTGQQITLLLGRPGDNRLDDLWNKKEHDRAAEVFAHGFHVSRLKFERSNPHKEGGGGDYRLGVALRQHSDYPADAHSPL